MGFGGRLGKKRFYPTVKNTHPLRRCMSRALLTALGRRFTGGIVHTTSLQDVCVSLCNCHHPKISIFPPACSCCCHTRRDFRQVISLWHICPAPRSLLCLQLCLVHHLAEQIRAQTDCLQPNQYVKFCTAEFVMGHHGISIRLILYQTHIFMIYLGLLDRIYTKPAFFGHI